MLCYLFGGFIGLGCGLVGLLSTPIILVTNSIFGDLAYGGNILAKVIKSNILLKIYKFFIINS